MLELQWAQNVSLAARNTFGIAAKAAALCDIKYLQHLPQAFDLAAANQYDVLVLGEGSNIVFADNYPGLVLCITAHHCEVLESDVESALIRAEAGMLWNDLVHWTLARGWHGLENMALIPGTVGACPIQNIGAYGAEVAEFIETVEAYNRITGQYKRLPNNECWFGYRDSRFKQQRDEWVITAVEFRLNKSRALKMHYAGVLEELNAMGIKTPKAVHLAEAISRIRSRKLPNPALLGNAGSFFKNPILSNADAEMIQARYSDLPIFPAGDTAHKKISAAWLIEQAGWKAYRDGDAGVAAQHALVLVNYGHASGRDILNLAYKIRDSVAEKFAVTLEPEPRIIGTIS